MMESLMLKKSKSLLFLILTLTLFQCAGPKKLTDELNGFKVKTITLEPGMVRFIKFNIPQGLSDVHLLCGDKEIIYYEVEGEAQAYFSESYFSPMKPYDCHFVRGEQSKRAFRVKIRPYKYKEEKLRVDSKRVVLNKVDMARVEKEREILKGVYEVSSVQPYFKGPFRKPLSSYITSHFGTRRVYNRIKKGQHLGIDFRAAVGVPLPNSNRGKVVYAGDLFYTGNTIIIDHGMSIFTIYAHMSEVLVSRGDIVERGDILGKAGKTGRVSGPHLHWGVKVQGDRVSGFSLIEASKKQFLQ